MSIAVGEDVRFLFIGRRKETGEPVDGHIDADAPDGAVRSLAEQGIVATKIKPDPGPSNHSDRLSALAPRPSGNANNRFVPSPKTEHREEDKAVVIDRDKIRRNVAASIDHALATSFARGEGPMQIRARVANAIHGLFKDYRHITSEQPVDHSGEMQEQITKLQEMIQRTEKMLSTWSKFGPPRGGGGEGGGTKNRHKPRKSKQKEEDVVLREIFQANLDLMRSIEAGLTQGKPV